MKMHGDLAIFGLRALALAENLQGIGPRLAKLGEYYFAEVGTYSKGKFPIRSWFATPADGAQLPSDAPCR